MASFPQVSPPTPCEHSSPPPYMPRPSHSSRCNHPHNIVLPFTAPCNFSRQNSNLYCNRTNISKLTFLDHCQVRSLYRIALRVRTCVCVSVYSIASAFGGLVVNMLASGTQDRGFKPGQCRQISRAKHNPQLPFLRRGSKAVHPMSQIYGM
jgi:hypothetical protein